ncbi:Gfo/Idh/MocA family oxidoreductase [Alphaproteobacteria bacterium]|nr:Gfo/Idh/MocA family oxidoreductase [Alphaproteobacteria bacterium]
MKIKIIGAGSIGNHMANASRSLSFDTTVTDISEEALNRMKNEIYPKRYGKWDKQIKLFNYSQDDNKKYDLIIVGTPPDTHYKIVKNIIKQKPRAILVEKPICSPIKKEIKFFETFSKNRKINFFSGYNHTVGKSAKKVRDLLQKKKTGKILTIDVDWREHWQGIFNAHPWLKGPSDSYLGYWRRGGGALSEHSHAINIWQFFLKSQTNANIKYVNANISYINQSNVDYDNLSLLNLKSSNNVLGRVVQDVVTMPIVKNAKILTSSAFIEWHCERVKGYDEVIISYHNKGQKKFVFKKTRADDFIDELIHIKGIMNGKLKNDSPISIKEAIQTMKVISAAHKSSKTKKNIEI